MARMKYVISKGREVQIFSDTIFHNERISKERCLAAGFVNISIGYREDHGDESEFISIHCWGESGTLQVQSRGKEDEEIISNQLIS